MDERLFPRLVENHTLRLRVEFSDQQGRHRTLARPTGPNNGCDLSGGYGKTDIIEALDMWSRRVSKCDVFELKCWGPRMGFRLETSTMADINQGRAFDLTTQRSEGCARFCHSRQKRDDGGKPIHPINMVSCYAWLKESLHSRIERRPKHHHDISDGHTVPTD